MKKCNVVKYGHFDSPAKPIMSLKKLLIWRCSWAAQPRPSSSRLHTRSRWPQLKLNGSQTITNKGRFTRHYLCLVERPLRESSAVGMELEAAFWSRVSRALTRWAVSRAACSGCRQRQSHITGGTVRAPELSCTNLVIMRRALVIEAEIFKLPKGFRCSVPIKFNGMRASESHPQ